MSRFSSFEAKAGTVLGSGIKAAGDFPIVDAHDVQVDEEGGNLADYLGSLDYLGCSHEWSEMSEFSALLPAEQCTSKTVDYCSKCSLMRMNRVESHNWQQSPTSLSPSCTSSGFTHLSCTLCGKGNTLTFPALGHSLTTVAAQAPTYTSVGWNEHKKCTRSGCTYTEGYEEIPKLKYSITYDLTLCSLYNGTTTIGDGETVTITLEGNTDFDGSGKYYVFNASSFNVTGATVTAYTLENDDRWLTITVSNPTDNVVVKANATSYNYPITLYGKNIGSAWTSSTIPNNGSKILPISVNSGYWLDISNPDTDSIAVYGCEYTVEQNKNYPDNYIITLSNPNQDALIAVAARVSGVAANSSSYYIRFHTIGCTISHSGAPVNLGDTVEIPVSMMKVKDGYSSIDYAGIVATNCTCTWDNFTNVLTLSGISGDVIVVASAT